MLLGRYLVALALLASQSDVWMSRPAAADAALDGRFTAICLDDMRRNNPGWEKQAGEICACRLRFLHAHHSESDLFRLVQSVEEKSLDMIPEDVVKADSRYIDICKKDRSARP